MYIYMNICPVHAQQNISKCNLIKAKHNMIKLYSFYAHTHTAPKTNEW